MSNVLNADDEYVMSSDDSDKSDSSVDIEPSDSEMTYRN
jgi:hypothetical protein